MSKSEEITGAIDAAKNSGALALNVLPSPFMYAHWGIVRERVAALSLPTMYPFPAWAEEGGLIASAVVLIRKAREVSEAVAVKGLVEACAEGLVRTWQRLRGAVAGASASSNAAVTRNILRRWPSKTPSFSRSWSVRSQRTSASIAFRAKGGLVPFEAEAPSPPPIIHDRALSPTHMMVQLKCV